MKIGQNITNPGEMRTRVTIKTRSVTDGLGGFQTPTLVTLASMWARWVGVHGSEAWAASSVGAVQAATVLIRYRDDIDTTCVVVLNGNNYEITSIDDIQQRHEYLELKVQRMVPG